MSYVAEFTIPPEALPFGETLVENPEIRIEVERIVPTYESALPFFWVWGSDPEVFMDSAEREQEVTNTRLLERVDNGGLFRAEWSPNAAVINGLKRLKATIIESEGRADQWRFEVRAQNHDTFVDFQAVFSGQGIPISLDRLYDLAEVVEADRQTLTPKQRETLLTAHQEGYFEKPREITQEELAEHFGISSRAVSERLRRATRNLTEATIVPSGEQL